jgi:hypothetical protein
VFEHRAGIVERQILVQPMDLLANGSRQQVRIACAAGNERDFALVVLRQRKIDKRRGLFRQAGIFTVLRDADDFDPFPSRKVEQFAQGGSPGQKRRAKASLTIATGELWASSCAVKSRPCNRRVSIVRN